MTSNFKGFSDSKASSLGLDDVTFANTEISHIDGAQGELWIRGYPIEALSGHASFEAVCGLLWDGALPDAEREAEIRDSLGRARTAAYERRSRWLEPALRHSEPMAGLRAGLALTEAPSDEFSEACLVTATAGLFLAAWQSRVRGSELSEPSPSESHARDLVRLGNGSGDEERARALDAYLVTVAEHGMNASTFTARVVASTESDTVSAVTAAVGALKGRLHGGAPGPVLDMLDAVGTEDRARAYLEAELAANRRIMGMGHRIYRVRDPRALVLERATQRLAGAQHTPRLNLARHVERVATELLAERHPERRLCANVEFFTAVLLEAVSVPRELFTVTFAAARVAGYCAHIAEQRRRGRIVRPASRYVGPRPSGEAPTVLAVSA
ncbi:MAG TPA: citrate synthase [Polyangiaceae bacterium]|nr:citrate synthase [Polyangiaceae bacterium]